MTAVFVLLMVLVLFLDRTSRADVNPTLPFSEYLDSNTDVLLRWGFDVVEDTITFEVTVKTTGWVGFGFSPNGGMVGSDIVIGGVGSDGIYFQDMNADGNVMPDVDQKQDYKVLSLTEADGQTVMKFRRSIEACDEHDFPISETPVKLIYAYGTNDDIGYHKRLRGTKEVNLLNYMPRTTVPDGKHFDLTITNLIVPAQYTYYHCKVMRLPEFDRKYHIYRVEPVIQNLDVVHHLLLYQCPPSVTEPLEEECYTKHKEPECIQAVAVWGVGGGAFEFPKVAGLPVGGDGNGTFYRLEVHYNNPYKTAGIVDNSGLRFYYTAQLRQFDAAILQIGLLPTVGKVYAIPPKATSFLSYGLCDTSYFPQVLSPAPADLKVFAVILHTHLAGRKVRVGHIRDGKQIDFLALNEHYNFEFQQVTNMGKTKTVKIGDKLVVECTYETKNRTGLTWGGLGTNDEMCLAFLFYYPATALSACSSLPNKQMLMAKMGAANSIDWVTIMNSKVWDDTSVLQYQKILSKIEQHTIVANDQSKIFQLGRIPELRTSPSSSCLSRAEVQSDVTGILLLALTLSFILS